MCDKRHIDQISDFMGSFRSFPWGVFAFSAVNVEERASGGAPCFWVLVFTPLWRLREGDPALFCGRFCDLVNSITEEAWKGPEEGDCDNETLEVKPPSLKRRSTQRLRGPL